jgi:hypothetical protein
MIAIGLLFVRMLCDFFKPRPRLEAEILILRHQLTSRARPSPRRTSRETLAGRCEPPNIERYGSAVAIS